MLPLIWSSQPGQSIHRGWRIAALLVFAGMVSGSVLAQQAAASSADELAARYPKGSIQEVGQADRALAEIGQTRARAEEQHLADQRACYPKFFASQCLETAKEQRRAVMEKITPIEVEATIFKRKANVAERDRVLAEKQARDKADAEERMKNLPENEKAAAEKAARAERKMAEKPDGADPASRENTARIQQHEARLKAQQEDEQRKAPERAKNAEAHQRKVQEAQERQRKVEEKKQQKEAERKSREAAPRQ